MSNSGVTIIEEALNQLVAARQREAVRGAHEREAEVESNPLQEESVPSQAMVEQMTVYRKSHPGTDLAVIRRVVVVGETAEVDYVAGEGIPSTGQVVQFSLTTTVTDANTLSTRTELVLAQIGG